MAAEPKTPQGKVQDITCRDGPVGALTNLVFWVRPVPRWGSCRTEHEYFMFLLFACHRHTHSHFILQCLPPPCGEKTIAAATDLSFQAATKERPPSVAGLYALFLMGQQKYHLFSPSKDSTRRAPTKPAKNCQRFFFFFYPLSLFGSDVFCVPVNSDVTMNVPLCPGSTVGRCQVSGHISGLKC